MLSVDKTSAQDFERLLAWLGPDRERAAEKYELVRRNLVSYFRRHGAVDPLGLADDVFVRVTARVGEITPTFVGEPGAYFLGVARNVLSESRRRPPPVELKRDIPVFIDPEAVSEKELRLQGMERCWERLSTDEQIILMRYYPEAPAGRASKAREELAAELSLSLNTLRVTTHRIRAKLRRCIEKLTKNEILK